MPSKTAELLMICDENYAQYTGTTLTSLFKSNRHLHSIIIHLMTNHITSESKKGLTTICQQYNRSIIFHDIEQINIKLKSNNAPSYKGSYLPIIKLCFDSFQNDLTTDRLIYIDSDMIINGKIDPLLDVNLENKLCSMVNDTTINSSKLYKKRLGLEKNITYYNAGMMIFNTSCWIQNSSNEKVFSYMRQNKCEFPFFEQDIINILFHNDILPLPIIYNYSATILDLGIKNTALIYKWTSNYKKEVKTLSKNIVIYHGLPVKGARPWMQNSIHPLKNLWDANTNTDLWDTSKNPIWKPSLSDKILLFIQKHFPMFIYIPIHKIGLQLYFTKLIKAIK